jgi:uncharacterized protein YacL (UPF0231 family)
MPNIIIEHLQEKLRKHTEKPLEKPRYHEFWQWLYMNDYLDWTLSESQEEKVIRYNDYLYEKERLEDLIDYFERNNIDQNTINDFLSGTYGNSQCWVDGMLPDIPKEIFTDLMDELNIEQTWRKS